MGVMARLHKNGTRADKHKNRKRLRGSTKPHPAAGDSSVPAEQHPDDALQQGDGTTSPQGDGSTTQQGDGRTTQQGDGSTAPQGDGTTTQQGDGTPTQQNENAKPARWSRSRWLITVAAVVVGAIVVALLINLTVDKTTSHPHELSVGGAVQAGPEFAHASMGSCLNWNDKNPGQQISTLEEVPCEDNHRFEVAGIIDLTMYPSQRFGENADPLSAEQVESLRLGLCRPLVDSYLPQGLDPAGRFRVGLLHPDVGAWKRGERTLVCGIEATNTASPEFTGKVGKQDQSITWANGACVYVNPERRYDVQTVDCRDPHMMEIVGTVDLSAKFGDRMPSKKEQNKYSERQCVALATSYMGGPEQLRDTTLTVLWSRVSLAGWNAGSRQVTCSLAKAGKGGFATLEGPAKGPFTIDGKKPRKPKKLPPRGSEQLPDMHNDPLLKHSVPGD